MSQETKAEAAFGNNQSHAAGQRCYEAAERQIRRGREEQQGEVQVTKLDVIHWALQKTAELFQSFGLVKDKAGLLEVVRSIDNWESKVASLAEKYLLPPYKDGNFEAYVKAELQELPLKMKVFKDNFETKEEIFVHKLLKQLDAFVRNANEQQRGKFCFALSNIYLAVLFAVF